MRLNESGEWAESDSYVCLCVDFLSFRRVHLRSSFLLRQSSVWTGGGVPVKVGVSLIVTVFCK